MHRNNRHSFHRERSVVTCLGKHKNYSFFGKELPKCTQVTIYNLKKIFIFRKNETRTNCRRIKRHWLCHSQKVLGKFDLVNQVLHEMSFYYFLFIQQNNIDVTLVARNEARLQKSQLELLRISQANKQDCQSSYAVCDVSRMDEIDSCFKQLSASNKRPVDILVNSAGIVSNQLLMMTRSDELERVIATNLLGTIWFTKLVLKQMVKNRNGTIINIGKFFNNLFNKINSCFLKQEA